MRAPWRPWAERRRLHRAEVDEEGRRARRDDVCGEESEAEEVGGEDGVFGDARCEDVVAVLRAAELHEEREVREVWYAWRAFGWKRERERGPEDDE
jgi:hypothetical protein